MNVHENCQTLTPFGDAFAEPVEDRTHFVITTAADCKTVNASTGLSWIG